jgi:small subunit ribosomal protein S9
MAYFYALGRRKKSTATVRLHEGKGESTINGKPIKKLYPKVNQHQSLEAPFNVTDTEGEYHFTAIAKGGGVTGQLEAVQLGIARALVKADETLKPALKKVSLLTRDDRMVERKKTGLRKARKAPQFSKR